MKQFDIYNLPLNVNLPTHNLPLIKRGELKVHQMYSVENYSSLSTREAKEQKAASQSGWV